MKRALSILALGTVFAARTAEACPKLTIEADESALVPMVEAAFATRHDIDTCARVVLSSRGRRITITVTLPDGRTAVRTVSRQADIVGALEALLRVPEVPADGAADDEIASDDPPPPAPTSAEPFVPPLEPRDALGRAPGPARSAIGAELGVGTSARIGERSSVGVGAIFIFDVRSWLIGAQGRMDRYTTHDNDAQPPFGASVAAIGGRRLHFDGVSLDIFTGAGMRMEDAQADVPFRIESPRRDADVPPPPPLRGVPSARTALDVPPERNDTPEIVFGARLNFRPRSILRAFVSLDGAVGPAWSFGLMLGAAVGS